MLCVALQKSSKSDVADLLRVRFSNIQLEDNYDNDGLFEEIESFLKNKFGKTKREEIEYYYNSFKTPRNDDQMVLNTIMQLEADLQGLRNFSVEIDERLATIQLTQNCRLYQNELQQVKALAGLLDQKDILRNTIQAIKEISSVKQ